MRELVGPHHHLLLPLPLEGNQLVSDLKPVLVDLVVAEWGPHFEIKKLRAHFVGVEARGAGDAFGVDQAPGVARRREVGRLAPELRLVFLDELLVTRLVQHGFPLRNAVDVLGRGLERVVEFREVAAHGEAVHLRVDVELLHLPR